MERTRTIEIDPPLKSKDGLTLSSITLREPTIGEMDVAAQEPTVEGNTTKLVQLVAGIPAPMARLLPIRVASQADEFLAGFISDNSQDEPDLEPVREIQLDPPVVVKGVPDLTLLVLTEPTIGAMDTARRTNRPFLFMATLIAQVAGITVLQAKALPISVGQEAIRYLLGFSQAKPAA